jgi:hypothetical protein
MATYLNDLRLTELATGEGSGTWGTTTNTSLELIGEALGYATQQVFGSDADATTTIADGASDPARAMYFKITSAGSLTATRTCTIAPNTISRVMFIENATTGSQSIAISQGSGASVTILAGKTAVVYLDGAGSGAAVVDAMAGVDPGVTDTLAEVLAAGNTSGANNLIIDNGQAITTNTINETTAASGVTIDSVLLKDDGVNATNLEITNLKANDGTAAGSIADSTGVVTLASSVLTTADINGGTIDGTTLGATTPASVAATTGTFSGDISVAGIGTIKQIDSNSVMIGSGAVNLRMIDVTSDIRPVDSAGLGVDGTVDLGDANARFKDLYLSGAVNAGAATFGGVITANAGVVVDNFTLDGTTLALSSGNFTVDVAGNIILDADSGEIEFKDGGTTFGNIAKSGNDLRINQSIQDGDIVFRGNDGGSIITALTLDLSEAGAATFNAGITATTGTFSSTLFSDTFTAYSGGAVTFNAGATSGFVWINAGTLMTLDASGNLGLGVVPSAWGGTQKSLQLPGNSVFAGGNDVGTIAGNNMYWDGSAYKYIATATANMLQFSAGSYLFRQAPSGTAGNPITFTTAMTLDASGNLLVGKTALDNSTVGIRMNATGDASFVSDGTRPLVLNRKTSDGDIALFLKDNTTVGSIGSRSGVVSYIVLDPRSGVKGAALIGGSVDANNGIINPGKADGDIADDAISLGGSSSRFKDLYLSGGVYLGGTGAANLLDDYEEGTWTPTITNSTGSYTTQVGRYTKIGNLVYVNCNVNTAFTNTGTTPQDIGGLPFTSENVGSLFSVGTVFPVQGFNQGNLDIAAQGSINSTSVGLYTVSPATGINYTNIVSNTFGTTVEFEFSLCYRAA